MEESISDVPELDQAVILAEESTPNEEVLEPVIVKFDPIIHPHLVLSLQLKNNNLREAPAEFVFTKDFGRLDCPHRWFDQNQIVMGRQHGRNTESQPTVDIDLGTAGRVSHRHCRLITKTGWKGTKKLSVEFLQFLKVISRKSSPWHQLPRDLVQLLWTYVKPKSCFFIQDLGSKFGTFLKLKHPTQVFQESVWSIGVNSIIKIIKVRKNLPTDQLPVFLRKWEQAGLIIVKAQQADATLFSFMIISIEDYKGKTISNYVVCASSTVHITIGRHLSNHIVINHEEVSRRHCTISFQSDRWLIRDGTLTTLSRNGTWRDLRSVEDIKVGRPSQLQQIESEDEIKLGQTYLKFQLMNC